MAPHPEDPRHPEPPADVIITRLLLEMTGTEVAYRQVSEFRYGLDLLVRQMLPAMVRGLAGDAAIAAHQRKTAEQLARLAPPSGYLGEAALRRMMDG